MNKHFVEFAYITLKIHGPQNIQTLTAAFRNQGNDVSNYEDDEALAQDERFEVKDGIWSLKQ